MGGYARIKTKVDELRETYPDNLWLNVGDEFQGTLFYSFYGPSKIGETLNELKFDAMTLGNHEWDGGDDELGDFLNSVTFPVVSCNVESEHEKLKSTIKKYQIFEQYDLAIIGATTEETAGTSSPGNLTTFLNPIPEIQKAIYEIRNTTNIKRIIALTHLGYDVDQLLAAQTEGLSLIIGGHTHTPLGDLPKAEGTYPTIVEDLAGKEVFIVQAYRWGEYLGSIDMTFDQDGSALAYHGAPIHMTSDIKPDAELGAKIKGWRAPFEAFAAEVVGSTTGDLDQTACGEGDCTLGQAMTDAMLDYCLDLARGSNIKQPDFALINAKGVRHTIPTGEITRGTVLRSLPFGSDIIELDYSGAEIRKVLEGCVSQVSQYNGEPLTSWFQISKNIKVEYNPNNEPGSKLVDVTVAGESLDDTKKYRVVTLDFLAGGGDNILEETTAYYERLDTEDEVLVQYIRRNSPLTPQLEERVVQVDRQPEDGSDNGNGSGGSGGSGGDGGNGGDGSSGQGSGSGGGPAIVNAATVGHVSSFAVAVLVLATTLAMI